MEFTILGKNLGIAFQLQDDYLDVFGDPNSFGKQVGGDIIENKKTYLYLKALEFTEGTENNKLLELFSSNSNNVSLKVEAVKDIFISSGSAKATKQAISDYTTKAFSLLEDLDISEDKKHILKEFGEELLKRDV